MLVQFRHFDLEHLVKHVEVLVEQAEILLVKAAHSLYLGLLLAQLGRLEQRSEKPESFFLLAPVQHEDEACEEVHALAVAYLLVVDRKGLEHVLHGLLACVVEEAYLEKLVIGKSTV